MDNLNVHEVQKTESTTRQNEAILSLFYDLPFIGMAITSPETLRWVKFNDRLCEIFGYSREELTNITWTEITHPDDLDLDVAEFTQVMRGESEGYVMDKRFIRKDGQIIYVTIDVKCIRKPDRTVDFFVATVQDISDRKNAEQALQQLNEELEQRIEERTAELTKSEARNLAILQALPDLLLILEPDGTCLECITPATNDKSNYLPIKHHVSEILPPETLAAQIQLYEKAIATGELQIYEHQLSKFGKTVYEEVRISHYGKDQLLVIVRDISSRKLAEQQLQDVTDRLTLAIKSAAIGIWEWDLVHNCLIWDERTFELYEVTPDPSLDAFLAWASRVHPHDRAIAESAVQQALDGVKDYDIEFRIVLPDNSIRYIKAYALIQRNDAGEPQRMVGINFDISDRKLAEKALLKSETHLKVGQRIGKIGSWECEITTGKLTWTDEIFHIYGLEPSPNPPNYDQLNQYVHPDDWERFNDKVQTAINLAQPYDIEYRIIHADGAIIYVLARTEIIYDLAGQLTHIIGTAMDISDRKLAEKALLKSDTHLKIAQRIGKIGSWEFEINTGHLTWTDEIFRIYGLEPSPNPPSYDELKLYIHPDDWEHFHNTVQNAINFSQDYDLEHRIIHPDGAIIYVLARGEMIYDSSGQLTHIIGTAMDISDRKISESKILQTSHQLANINRELETFSYSVSHDLRAPLRHVNGFVSALQQHLKNNGTLSDPKVVHYLQVIEKSSQKMGDLIDGLLTLSRYGRRPLELKQVSIRRLVDEAIEIVRSDPNFNPLTDFEIGDLPTIVGDLTLLQQVFHNLIGNAVKFSRNQPIPLIQIDTLPNATIRIKDNGVGFQMEYADKLFGAFQRLHTEKEFEGTGIGLAIVQRIVQRNGGSIWAESSPNQGATFFLKI